MTLRGGSLRIAGRDYYELLGPSGVATLKRLLTESLENFHPDNISRRHLEAGLARLRGRPRVLSSLKYVTSRSSKPAFKHS
jgi:hypothetical protein